MEKRLPLKSSRNYTTGKKPGFLTTGSMHCSGRVKKGLKSRARMMIFLPAGTLPGNNTRRKEKLM